MLIRVPLLAYVFMQPRQHTTLTKDRHPCPRWDSNPQSQQARGRSPPGHWDQRSIGFLHCPFHLTLRILDGVHFYDSICLVTLYKTLNSGLATALSKPGQSLAFGNSLPPFYNHELKTEKSHKCANMGKINDSNYGGNCTSRDFQFGTQKISDRWIFVQQSVHPNS